MGAALESTGRDIVYSCSWPAYIGDNETQKPFGAFVMDGCNLWRNWWVRLWGTTGPPPPPPHTHTHHAPSNRHCRADIQCGWGSLSSIINRKGRMLHPPPSWHVHTYVARCTFSLPSDWGDYSSFLAPIAGPGHWHDPDVGERGQGGAVGDALLPLRDLFGAPHSPGVLFAASPADAAPGGWLFVG
jgi:hypothetical protein